MEFVLTTKEKKVEKRNDFHHKSYSRPGSGEGAGTQRASCSWVGSVNGPSVPPASLTLSFKVNLSSSESPPPLLLSLYHLVYSGGSTNTRFSGLDAVGRGLMGKKKRRLGKKKMSET